MKKKGLFITFEGPEGAGKSTQVKNLCSHLESKKIKYVVLREPGATEVGEAIREILLHSKAKIAPETELLLYLAARSQVVREKIIPALEKGYVVICDRFEDSTLAYQGFGRRIPIQHILKASWLARGFLKPDLTFLLDLDPKVGFSRIERGHDRMESQSMAFHKRVRKGFLTVASWNPKRFAVLKAKRSPEVLSNEIASIFNFAIYNKAYAKN